VGGQHLWAQETVGTRRRAQVHHLSRPTSQQRQHMVHLPLTRTDIGHLGKEAGEAGSPSLSHTAGRGGRARSRPPEPPVWARAPCPTCSRPPRPAGPEGQPPGPAPVVAAALDGSRAAAAAPTRRRRPGLSPPPPAAAPARPAAARAAPSAPRLVRPAPWLRAARLRVVPPQRPSRARVRDPHAGRELDGTLAPAPCPPGS